MVKTLYSFGEICIHKLLYRINEFTAVQAQTWMTPIKSAKCFMCFNWLQYYFENMTVYLDILYDIEMMVEDHIKSKFTNYFLSSFTFRLANMGHFRNAGEACLKLSWFP